jgi:hypothetical protein
MRVHVNFEAILFAFAQHANGVVHKIEVIDPRSFMLKSLPGDGVAQYVETPTAQTREVNVGRPIVEIKWARDEAVPASFGILPKSIQEVGGFTNWGLCRTGEIDPAK